jgi:hypothetical protein
VPVGFDNVVAGRALVGFCTFHPAHVSASREMIVRKFDDTHLGTVLHSCKGLVLLATFNMETLEECAECGDDIENTTFEIEIRGETMRGIHPGSV